MADSAMERTVKKDDGEDAASGSFGHRHAGTPNETVAAAKRAHSPGDREPRQRGKPARLCESLHEWIVHFDAERSSGPPASSDEE